MARILAEAEAADAAEDALFGPERRGDELQAAGHQRGHGGSALDDHPGANE